MEYVLICFFAPLAIIAGIGCGFALVVVLFRAIS